MFHAPCWGNIRKTLSQLKQLWQQEQPHLHLCLLQALSESWDRLLRVCSTCTTELICAHSESQRLPGKQWSPRSFGQGMPESTFSMPGKCSIFWRCIKRMPSLRTLRGISTFFPPQQFISIDQVSSKLSWFLQAAFGRGAFWCMDVTIKKKRKIERAGRFQRHFIVQSLLQAELDLPQSGKVR